MIDQQKANVYEFSGYRIDADERLLKRNGDVISLPPKVIDLLFVLLRSGGRVLTKNELMESVWSDSFVEETNLTHNISILRRVFDEKRSGEKFIETIPRRGYRFIPEVKVGADEDFDLIEVERTNTRVVVNEELEAEDQAKGGPGWFSGRRLIGIAAGLVGVAILGSLAYWYLAPKPVETAQGAFQFANARRITSEGNAKMATVSPDGKFVAYVTVKDRRHTLWVKNIATESGVPILSDSEAPIKSVRFGPGDNLYFVMNDALHYIPMLGGPVQKLISVAGGSANQIFTFSPDQKQVAFMRVSEDNTTSTIMIADTYGRSERLLVSTRRPNAILRSPDWSPDGKSIAVVTETPEGFQTISVIAVADGTITPISTTPKFGSFEQAEWLPEGDALLGLRGEGEVWRISYPDGASTKVSDNLSRYSSMSLSASGSSFVGTKLESDGHVWVLPLAAGGTEKQITRGFDKNDGAFALDWLSNDSIRYEAGPTGQSWTVHIDGREPVRTVERIGYMSAASPDGKFIVSQQWLDEGNRYGLFRTRITDGERKLLVPVTPVAPRFSPDGKWIVYTDYRDDVSVWRVSVDGGEPVKITNLSGDAINPVVSPDGSRFAFVWWYSPASDAPAKVGIASFPDGNMITMLTVPLQWQGEAGTYSKETIQWSPDGKAIDFIRMTNGVSNIWRQPIDGGDPVQITFLETGRIANFAYSPDYKHVALSRGNFASDVFLVSKGD